MKIAILYFCAGPYHIFWNDFSESARAHFCNGDDIHFFVFTDSEAITSTADTTIIFQQNLGWPFISLYRYRIFRRIESELSDYERVVFFNANCLFIDKVFAKDFFGEHKDLIACEHPAFYNSDPREYPYETRPESSAKVIHHELYAHGALMGGTPAAFLRACDHLSLNIEHDLNNGILARWFDESHWNAFINNNYHQIRSTLHVLTPSYLYPEDWDLPFKPLIQLRNKNKVLDMGAIKGSDNTASVKQSSIMHRLKTAAVKLKTRIMQSAAAA